MSIYNDNYNNKNETDMINNFIQSVRRKYWSALFSNDKFTGQLTNNLKMDYQNSVDKLKDYDFTIWNIREIQLQMKREITKGIEDTIIDLFEELSNKYHWYDETSKNRHYFDGWKTNKSYIINQKVIIPLNGFRHSYYDGTKTLDLGYDVYRKLSDIEKCLNYLDGGLTEAIDLRKTLDKAQEEGQTKKIQLKYYNVTFFKKGTCHIQFTNEELLKKFNIYGAQNKRWLPPTYGKKTYEEMDAEEKAVIDSFEGEKSYKDTLNHTDYYLENATKLNLLEMAS